MNAPHPTVRDGIAPQELAQAFFQEVWAAPWPGYLVICSAPPGNRKGTPLTSRCFAADDVAAAAAYAAATAAHRHVWFGVGTQAQRPEGTKRGGSDTVAAIPGVWSDVDVRHAVHAKTNLPATIEQAMELADKVGLPPTIVIDTGHGLQPHWLFKEPWLLPDDAARAEAQQFLNDFKATVAGYAAEKGWDVDAVSDLARLLRPPGTVNRKEPADPRPVRIYRHNPECRYTIEQIRAVLKRPEPTLALPSATPAEVAPSVSARGGDDDQDQGLLDLAADDTLLKRARAAKNGAVFDAIWGGSNLYHGGDVSRADMSLLVRLAFWTGKDAARMDRLFRASERYRAKWDEKHFANGDTYGQGSVARAIARTTVVYDPAHQDVARADDGRDDADDGKAAGTPAPVDEGGYREGRPDRLDAGEVRRDVHRDRAHDGRGNPVRHGRGGDERTPGSPATRRRHREGSDLPARRAQETPRPLHHRTPYLARPAAPRGRQKEGRWPQVNHPPSYSRAHPLVPPEACAEDTRSGTGVLRACENMRAHAAPGPVDARLRVIVQSRPVTVERVGVAS